MSPDDRRRSQEATLRRLGLGPAPSAVVRRSLDEAVGRAEAARRAGAAEQGPPVGDARAGGVTGTGPAGAARGALDGATSIPAGVEIVALDAGCGSRSALAPLRPRIRRLVGADLAEPRSGIPSCLDEFVAIDLGGSPDVLPAATFDIVLSSYTVEHLADPATVFANIGRWLRPGGTLVLSTVNRRHPFVAAYLGMPRRLRERLQPLVRDPAEDVHPLVGACNDPATLHDALAGAGFVDIRIRAISNLGRAWGRHRLTFLAGVLGDVLASAIPSRRSTLVASARLPEPAR